MALEGHMTGLSDKHRQLEEKIAAEQSHPSSDPLTIAKLKREKLRLKDELQRLTAHNAER